MDDIKLFAKKKKELKTLIQTIRIYSQHIGMEFDIEKCAEFIMKSGKGKTMDGAEKPNQERIRTLEKKENYKYPAIFEADTQKQTVKKEKIRKEYLI